MNAEEKLLELIDSEHEAVKRLRHVYSKKNGELRADGVQVVGYRLYTIAKLTEVLKVVRG